MLFQVQEVLSEAGLVTVQQRLSDIAGAEGHSISVTTLTDVRTETNKVHSTSILLSH